MSFGDSFGRFFFLTYLGIWLLFFFAYEGQNLFKALVKTYGITCMVVSDVLLRKFLILNGNKNLGFF